jgi:hypothetical protein
MSGATPPLPRNAFMAWCTVKATFNIKGTAVKYCDFIPSVIVCMYVCVCVCVYVCMYVCVYVCVCVSVRIRTR